MHHYSFWYASLILVLSMLHYLGLDFLKSVCGGLKCVSYGFSYASLHMPAVQAQWPYYHHLHPAVGK